MIEKVEMIYSVEATKKNEVEGTESSEHYENECPTRISETSDTICHFVKQIILTTDVKRNGFSVRNSICGCIFTVQIPKDAL